MKCKNCALLKCERRGSAETECFYEKELREQKQLEEIPYWEHFRAEAAKDILAGMMQHKVLSDSSMTLFIPKEKVVSCAIELADELIKQLKEKEKK